MKIVVDFTPAIGDPTGVGAYVRGLVRALIRAGGADRIVAAVHAFRHSGWHARVREVLAGAGAFETAVNRAIPHRVLLEAETRFGAPPLEALFGPADVYHGTNFLAPPARRARTVITVHDLAFVKFPDLPVPHRYRRYLPAAIRRADRILAVSEATARDVKELFPDAASKVRVAPLAAPESLPRLPEWEFETFRRRHGVPDRYFLFVGTIEPRKNLGGLLRAFLAARPRLPAGVGLVLAGRRGWACREELRLIRSAAAAGVRWIGFVPGPVRNSLLAGALALVVPSWYEGFGLPVLEAFAAGTTVLASDAGALPEVGGDAADFFPPGDPAAIATALVRTAADGDRRAELVRKGRARAGRFTWDRTAALTREVYAGG